MAGHRKQVRHFHEPGHFHEFTFSTYQRRPLLTDDSRLKHLSRCIDAAGTEVRINLLAFVFMPEHVHLLTFPLDPNPDLGLYLARIKQPFSKEIKRRLVESHSPLVAQLIVRERPGKTCFRFWQEGPGYDRNLNEPATIRSSLDYIHNNPVKRKLCGRAIEWNWSSARYYLGEPPKQQMPELPFIHGLPAGTLD